MLGGEVLILAPVVPLGRLAATQELIQELRG